MDNDGLDSGYWMLYNLLLLHRSVESKAIKSPAFGKDSSVAGKMRSLFSRQLTKVAEQQRTETSRNPSKEEISDEEAEQEEIGGKVETQPIHHQYDPNNNNHNSYGQMQGLIGEQGPMNDQAQGVSFDMMGLFEELQTTKSELNFFKQLFINRNLEKEMRYGEEIKSIDRELDEIRKEVISHCVNKNLSDDALKTFLEGKKPEKASKPKGTNNKIYPNSNLEMSSNAPREIVEILRYRYKVLTKRKAELEKKKQRAENEKKQFQK